MPAISEEPTQPVDQSLEHFVRGQGETVLLIPGLGGDARQFDGLASSLVDGGFRTVAVNPRGVGASTGTLHGLTLHDLAGDVARLIENLRAAPAHVIGRAYGNRVARCLAADRPDLVRSLCLLAAGGLFPPRSKGAPDAHPPPRAPSRAAREARRSVASTAKPKIWPRAAAAQLAADAVTPLADWWTGGSAPILVIQALEDTIAPPANGRALRDELGQRVRLVELARAGHAFLFDQPAVVTEHLLQFLRDQSSREA